MIASTIIYGRTGPPGSSPDFYVEFKGRDNPVGIEMTAITRPEDERAPRVMRSVIDAIQHALRARVANDDAAAARFSGKGMLISLSRLPSDARRRQLVPKVIEWLEAARFTQGVGLRPDSPEVRELIEEPLIEGEHEGPPIVGLCIGGVTGRPSVLELLQRKRAQALRPDFRRFGETWLVIRGPLASICATAFGLSGEVLKEAADCIASRVVDRIFLVDPNENEVWEFGWGKSRGV